jgi:hypothetical protein
MSMMTMMLMLMLIGWDFDIPSHDRSLADMLLPWSDKTQCNRDDLT